MGYKHIEVKQVAGFIGAEINGVDLSHPLNKVLSWAACIFRSPA